MGLGTAWDIRVGSWQPLKHRANLEANTLVFGQRHLCVGSRLVARLIVSGGAGVGSADNFKLIFDLADALGGAVGASRAAVDAGFVGKEHQVGQTGTTVRPKLYIACGVSGQVQHRAGMQESGKIIAVNTDPNAPIFAIAHYGIVGDLNDVIPKIIDAYRRKL